MKRKNNWSDMENSVPDTVDASNSNVAEVIPAFSIEWVKSFMDGYFERKGKDSSNIELVDLKVEKNSIQGILSTAYLIDVLYKDSNPPLGKCFVNTVQEFF